MTTYTAPMVDRARQLSDDGWTATAISRRLKAEFGVQPARDTVRAWVDPDAAERLRIANAASKRRSRARNDAERRTFVERAMLTLRLEDGLPYSTISKVMRRFYGVEASAETIRHRLYELGVEKNPNKTRAGFEQAERKAAA